MKVLCPYLLKNTRQARAQMGWMQILLTVTAQWSLKEIHLFYLAKFSLRLSELHLAFCPFNLLLKVESTLSSDQAAQSFVQLGLENLWDLTVSQGNLLQCIIMLKYIFFIPSWNSLSWLLIDVSHSLFLSLCRAWHQTFGW